MKRQLLALVFVLVPALAMAAGGAKLDTIKPDLYNYESLHNGARLFVNYCMGCHSAEHQRFARTAEDLGIPQDLIEENLILSPQLAYNDQMRISMTKSDSAVWFGTPPPDLSLMARLKSPDYIYSFLRSFYLDPSKPWGVNNTVFPDVGMPHMLADLQGTYELACDPNAQTGKLVINADGVKTSSPRDCFKQVDSGSLNEAEFDKAMYDLTNFLTYVAEPSKYQANAMAPKVLIFILIFFFVSYLLKKEYWRDVKPNK